MTREEFTSRILSMQDELYRIAYGQLRDSADRRDAVQNALFKAWEGLPQLRNEEHFKTWLVRILINECHNLQRTQKRIAPLEAAPERSETMDNRFSDLHDALLLLPEKLRLPIQLHYMEGYTTDEIARILRVPVGTIRSRLRQARSMLKEHLQED